MADTVASITALALAGDESARRKARELHNTTPFADAASRARFHHLVVALLSASEGPGARSPVIDNLGPL